MFASGLPTAHVSAAPTGIRGKLSGIEKLRPEVYEEAKQPAARRYNWREPSPTVPKAARELFPNPSRDLAIGVLGRQDGKPLGQIAVKVSGGRTSPSMLVVTPGTPLLFKNVDPFPHKLYQLGEPKWPANKLDKGATREWSAPGPGRYEIRDELFPSVRTYIVVEPKLVAYAYPTRAGRFTVDVPAGDYTLRVFMGGKLVSKEAGEIKVTEKQGVFELTGDLVLGAAK